MSSDFEFVCESCKSGFIFDDPGICSSYDAYEEKGEYIRGFTPPYLDSHGDFDNSSYLETKQSILDGDYCSICEGHIDDEEYDYYSGIMEQEAGIERQLAYQEQLGEESMKNLS